MYIFIYIYIYIYILVAKSCLTLAPPWPVAHQAPLSMGFLRQEYWTGLPLPPPGDLPDPGIEPRSPALQADSLPTEPPRRRMLCNDLKWEKNLKKEWKILYISTYMESRKMLLMNLSTGQQWRCWNKQTCGHSRGRRWMIWDSSTETYTAICKVGNQWEFAVWRREHKASVLWQPGLGRGMGRFKREGHTYTYDWFMLLYGRNHLSIVNCLVSNEKTIK